MDRKWIFKHIIGIIALALSNIKETEMKEYFCTGEGNWTTAMATCLDSGGTPACYLDLANGTEVKVEEGTSVWTADYFFIDYVDRWPTDLSNSVSFDGRPTALNESQTNANYECGYTGFTERHSQSSRKYKYTPVNVNFDICTSERRYLCGNSPEIVEGWQKATWSEAYTSCNQTYSLMLWNGKTFIENEFKLNYTHVEFWVDLVRRLVKDTLSRQMPNHRHVIKCGTSEGIERERNNNCDQDLQALCKLDHKTTDTRFSLTCLQASKTPETSQQPTEHPTELANSKTAAASAKLSTQSTVTSIEIFSSKNTSTMTEPFTHSTVISTELINSSDIQSTPDGLSKTTIVGIITAAVAVTIGCIVAVFLLLYFCRKRPKHKDANSQRVQFKRDSPSAAREFLGNNDDATNIASHDNKAEVHDYHEACVNVPDNILEPVNRNETKNGEYHYVCSVSENPKPPYKTPRRRSISESEYDTTNNVKVVNESSNIYSKLGYETPESVYDSTTSKPNRKPALDTNIYSKTSPGENLYDTTATGVGTSRLHDTALCPNDNIYSHTKAN